jgi:rhodanese-related sulfurtransferase
MNHITTFHLHDKMENDKGFILLNALPEDSFQEEHIPGSHNVPWNDDNLIDKVNKLAPSKDTEIVIYCANAECPASTKAGQKLEKAGFTNITEFDGGMEAWKNAGHRVESQA